MLIGEAFRQGDAPNIPARERDFQTCDEFATYWCLPGRFTSQIGAQSRGVSPRILGLPKNSKPPQHPRGRSPCRFMLRSTTSTHYRYDRLVTLSPQVVRLRPAPHCRTRILSYSLRRAAGETLHQLATGPAGQLSRPAHFPGQNQRVAHRSRPRRRGWRCSTRFDFFSRARTRKQFPFNYEAGRGTRAGPVPEPTCGNHHGFRVTSSRFPVRKSSRSIFSSS